MVDACVALLSGALAALASGGCDAEEPRSAASVIAASASAAPRAAGWFERERQRLQLASAQRPSASAAPSLMPWAPLDGPAGDFVRQQLVLRAATLGEGFVATGPALRGVLREGRFERHYELRQGHCYRLLAVGGIDLEALTLRVFNPSGLELARDEAHEPWASLGERSPLCPAVSGAYRVRLEGRPGAHFGLLVFGTP